MLRSFLLVALIGPAAPALASEEKLTNKELQEMVVFLEMRRELAVDRMRELVKDNTTKKSSGLINVERERIRLTALESLAKLESFDHYYTPELFPSRMKKNQVGNFRCDLGTESTGFTVKQVIGTDTLLVSRGRTPTIMIRGLSTENIVDDMVIYPKNAFRVAGTTTYKTVIGGIKTVFVVEPFDLTKKSTLHHLHFELRKKKEAEQRKKAAEILKKQAEQRKKAFEEQWERESRVWTDATGKHTVKAMYMRGSYRVEKGEGIVTLLKKDGSTITIPRLRLSQDDQKEVRRQIHLFKRRKQPARDE